MQGQSRFERLMGPQGDDSKGQSTSGSYLRCVFSLEVHYFCQEVFFSMYLPLVWEVYNRLFIDSLGVMVVFQIKKHLLGLTQTKNSPWPSVLTSPSVFNMKAAVSCCFLLHSPLQVYLIIVFPSWFVSYRRAHT